MPPPWLSTVAWISLGLSLACALAILGDILAGRRQPMAIMNVVWPITALYFGPLGLWAYWALGRPKAGQGHHHDHGEGEPGGDAESRPKGPTLGQVFVGTSHCGAGCTVGDLIGETAVAAAGLTLFGSMLVTDYVVDFALAYAVGIVFQYFAIAPMRGLGLKAGILAAIKADTLSLVAFEVGMFAAMWVSHGLLSDAPPGPGTASYWFLMQVAMIVGFATSFPANWWLIRAGLKEEM